MYKSEWPNGNEENIVRDHDVEVEAKGRELLLLKEIRDVASYLTQKRCIIQIKNEDALCCVRAIVTTRARVDRHHKWHSIRKGSHEQRLLARQLHLDVGNDNLSLSFTLDGTNYMFTHKHTLITSLCFQRGTSRHPLRYLEVGSVPDGPGSSILFPNAIIR